MFKLLIFYAACIHCALNEKKFNTAISFRPINKSWKAQNKPPQSDAIFSPNQNNSSPRGTDTTGNVSSSQASTKE